MSFVGLCGVLLGLVWMRFAIIERTRLRIAVFLSCYLVHCVVAVFFYNYALQNVTDSGGYYYDPFGFARRGFGLTTQFLYYSMHLARSMIGGTFLDYFLIFQAIGFAGLALMMRTFEEIYASVRVEQSPACYLLLFLPGLQFWSSPISKDGILFTAVCLTIWSAMNVRARYPATIAGIALMLLIRPHIAFISAGAIALSLSLDRKTGLWTKAAVAVIAGVGLTLAVSTMSANMNIDVTNADSVDNFLTTFQQSSQLGAGTTAVHGAFYVKMLSLLFRPLFFDATGALGYIASLDNLVLLGVFLVLAVNYRELSRMVSSVAFVRFALIEAIGIAIALALIYYNVGLGLRQKTMVIPGILVIFVALLALQQARRAVPLLHQGLAPGGPLRTKLDGFAPETAPYSS